MNFDLTLILPVIFYVVVVRVGAKSASPVGPARPNNQRVRSSILTYIVFLDNLKVLDVMGIEIRKLHFLFKIEVFTNRRWLFCGVPSFASFGAVVYI